MGLTMNFLALFMTILLVTGGESRRLLEASEASPVHSELPEPTLPVPKVELPPMPEIPKVESPPIPEIPKEELPPVPKVPKEELPQLPEIPKEELPPMPEIPKVESPPIHEIPKLPIPEGIPELPFAPPHAENSP